MTQTKVHKFQTGNYTYRLNGNGIDEISDVVQQQLKNLKYESKNILRLRLTVEEILLNLQERFGDDAQCTLNIGRRFRKPYISLTVAGKAHNPMETETHTLGDWSRNMLAKLGLSPTYSYTGGKNVIRFDLKAPALNPIVTILGAVVLAVVCGMIGLWMPEGFRTAMIAEVLPRISDTFFGVLGMIAGPLVFLSVLMGICGIGDTATLSNIGKKIILRFVGLTLLGSALCCAVFPVLFDLKIGEAAAGFSGLSEMVDMLFGMIPMNIIDPFLVNNSLQLIVLAVMIGIAMLLLGKRTAGLYSILEQLQMVIQTIMSWITFLLPLLIFVVLLQNIWSDSLNVLIGAWQPVVFTILFMALLLVIFLMYASFRLRVKPQLLARKLASGFMIALSTASSSAALGENCACSERGLGVQKKLVDFGLPLGIVTCCPGSAVGFMACVLYCAQIYDVQVSVFGLVLAGISGMLLVISAPPISGGLLSCYAVMFTQLGIPAEGLGVVMALNVILDFFCTATNVVGYQLILAMQAEKSELLNRKILLRESKK